MKSKNILSDITDRWSYRYQRFMLTPAFRKITLITPVFIALSICSVWISNPERQSLIIEALNETVDSIKARREFQFSHLVISGVAGQTYAEVKSIIDFEGFQGEIGMK